MYHDIDNMKEKEAAVAAEVEAKKTTRKAKKAVEDAAEAVEEAVKGE